MNGPSQHYQWHKNRISQDILHHVTHTHISLFLLIIFSY